MKIEILDAGEGYTYHISIPGRAGIRGDDYASMSEMFRDMSGDDFLQGVIDTQLNSERKAASK